MSDDEAGSYQQYLDFELEIGAGQGREYPLTVLQAPAGEGRAIMHFPFDELALENRLDKLKIALLRSGGSQRRQLTREEQAVQNFGHTLFDALLTGSVRDRYTASKSQARQQGKGLRLKLRIQPPELAALPWEYLYDQDEAEYLCLSTQMPVVRYLEVPQPPLPMAVSPPLRILGMFASPVGLPELNIENEKERLSRATADLQRRGLVELVWLEGQGWSELQRALRRDGPWHVFHFIGHGRFDPISDEGQLAFADETGRLQVLSAAQIARLLANHFSLRLVFLNACEGASGSPQDPFSSLAAALVRRGLPAVLAMQYEITDSAAMKLAQVFYESLADGLPVDAAVSEARVAVSMAITNSLEWGTPVLFMRSPDGVLFKRQPAFDHRQLPLDSDQSPPSQDLHAETSTDSESIAIGPEARFTLTQDQMEPSSSIPSPPDEELGPAPPEIQLIGPDEVSPEPHIPSQPTVDVETAPAQRPLPMNWIILMIAVALIVVGIIARVSIGNQNRQSATQTALALLEPTEIVSTADLVSPTAVSLPATLAPGTTAPLDTALTPDTSTPVPLPMEITDDYGVPMALIPGGAFMMGSDVNTIPAECLETYEGSDGTRRIWQEDTEGPVHEVYLDSYYIDEFEVTNSRYDECVNADACEPPILDRSYYRRSYYSNYNYANFPVINITWEMALSYCQWREARLPTEAEWEKAARGGLEGELYPWGNDPPWCNSIAHGANYFACAPDFVDTREVGFYSPNGFGLYDMVGNVEEWVSSLFMPYPYMADDGREDLLITGNRVLRGGDWWSSICEMRVAFRESQDQKTQFSTIGFRCARSP
jgi:formylglycine-generating enzyme required for sulfatase activity